MDHVILTDLNSIRCTRCGTTQEFPDRTSANVWVAIAKAFDEEHRGCAPSSVPTCRFCMSREHLAADHVKVTCKFPWQWPGNGDTGLSSRALFNHFTKGRVHEANKHDEIYLGISTEELANVATSEDILYLTRCGVRYDSDTDSLAMFT